MLTLLSQFCRIAVLVSVCWVYLFRSGYTTEAVVINPDKNFTLYYNSDQNASYRCVVDDGAEPVWEITCLHDGCISLQLLTPQLKYETGEWLVMEEVNNQSTLIVREEARRKQNMSIVCLSHSPDSFVLNPPVSKSYYITTYGPLSAPSKLELTIDSNGQHIFSWISPRVPQDVILICHVTGMNLSSGNVLLDIITTDNYVIVLNSTSRPPCSAVMFSMYCVNIEDDNARSNVSTKMENLPLSPDVGTVEQNFNVLLKLKAGLSLEIITKTANVCSKAYPVTSYHVNIDNDALGIRNTVSFNARGDDNGTQTIRFLLNSTNVPFLALNQVLNTSVTVCSSITCHTTGNVTLYVAPIQNPIIYYSNRSVALVCDVLKSSQATGCLFNLTSAGIDGTINVETFNVTMTSESKCGNDNCTVSSCRTTNSLPTNYQTIGVYAINQNGSVSNFSQPVRLINGTSDSEYSKCLKPESSDARDLEKERIIGGTLSGVIALVVIAALILVIVLIVVFKRASHNKPTFRSGHGKLEADGDDHSDQIDGSWTEKGKKSHVLSLRLEARVIQTIRNCESCVQEIISGETEKCIKEEAIKLLKNEDNSQC